MPGSAEEERAFDRYVYGERENCLFDGTNMSMSIAYVRGAIAEGLLRTGGVPEGLRLAPVPSTEARDLHSAARCYASEHRTEVDALLQTRPGSPQEVAAVSSNWNGLKACMTNVKARLNAPWIRFLLAEAVLRLPPPSPAGQ